MFEAYDPAGLIAAAIIGGLFSVIVLRSIYRVFMFFIKFVQHLIEACRIENKLWKK